MIHLIFSGLVAAVGFAAGAFTAHAAGERDREKARYYRDINESLVESCEKLEKNYIELADKSIEVVDDLELKLLESELEKDALYVVVRLQNSLVLLMQGIDRDPSFEVLLDFQQAVIQTNLVLNNLGEDIIPVPKDYFNRNLTRAKIKLAQKHITPTPEQIKILKRIMLSVSDGSVNCPHCDEANAVMKQMSILQCSQCHNLLDLISLQKYINWNHQQSILPGSQKADVRQFSPVA